jgi:hypothetical protein
VRKALGDDGPPRYQRARRGSLVDSVEAQIRELLRVTPTVPATVVAERIGWEHSIRTLRTRVSELRPVYLPPDPASRTTYEAGELAQFDFWFPSIELPVGLGQTRTAKRLPVMTTVSGYSLDSNDYPVHPAVVGRRIEVHADLHRVWVSCEGANRRRPPADLGAASDHHRRRARGRCDAAAPRTRQPAPPGRGRGHWRGCGDPLTKDLRPPPWTPRAGGVVMAVRSTTKTTIRTGRDVTSELEYLTRALKAPILREFGRTAGRTRP